MSNPERKRRIFVAWDSLTPGIETFLQYLRDRLGHPSVEFEVVGLKKDPHHGELPHHIASAIRRCDGLLALLDLPNAYVGWELGFALGLGKPVALALLGEGEPTWTRQGLFRVSLLKSVGLEEEPLLDLVGRFDSWPRLDASVANGTGSALLAQAKGLGAILRKEAARVVPGLAPLELGGMSPSTLPDHLNSIARAAWLVPEPVAGQVRDGDEVAQLAVAAGYLTARGAGVRLFRHAAARDQRAVRDAVTYDDLDQLAELLARWEEDTRGAGETGAPVDPLTRWRRFTRREHGDLLPFVRLLGQSALRVVPVELELEADTAVACLADEPGLRRVMGGMEGRLGTLRDLVERQLAAEPEGPAPRLLVVAEPGAGKTTLARHLAFRLAQEPKDPSSVDAPVAVFLSLSELARSGQDPLVAAGLELDPAGGEGALALTAELRLRAERRGQLWLLLDGLDEVDPALLGKLRNRLAGWCEALPEVVFVVLSRQVAVDDRNAMPGLRRCTVRHLGSARQRELVSLLLEPKEVDRLFQEVAAAPSIAPLVRNPLMLTLVAMLSREAWRADQAPPHRRVQLYRRAMVEFLRRGWRWDAEAGDTRGAVKDQEAAWAILRALALHLHGQGRESWPRKALGEALFALRQDDPTVDFALKAAWGGSGDGFLDDVGHNAGILGPRDGARADWRFLHRTFREFLAAEALAGRGEAEAQEAMLGGLRRARALEDEQERGKATQEELARWGEVAALVAEIRAEDGDEAGAEGLLRQLAAADPERAVRALRSVEGLAAGVHLEILLSAGRPGGGRDWEGADLDRILAGARGREAEAAGEVLAVMAGEGTAWKRAAGQYLVDRLDPAEGDGLIGPEAGFEAMFEESQNLAAHLLTGLRGIEGWARLSLLLRADKDDRSSQEGWPAWDGGVLDAAIDLVNVGSSPAAGALWEAVVPARSTRELGLLWYALERLGLAEAARFFRACGRTPPRPEWVKAHLPTEPIPEGRFWMGSQDGVGQPAEWPRHPVQLRTFALGRTPVTVAAWRVFDPSYAGDDAHPVNEVDWLSARLFCAWAGGRLPTEAEWEYACRAGTETAWSFGEDEAELDRHAWFSGSSGFGVRPVGQKAPNPWGLHDMHGNVWEWCEDRFGPYAPDATVEPAGPPSGDGRVLRGGGCWYGADLCRSAFRVALHPGVRLGYVGFRVCFAPRALGSRT